MPGAVPLEVASVTTFAAGDTPAEIVRAYASATGKSPQIPGWALGFWQCKLRYRTQDELLRVARAYKCRGIGLVYPCAGCKLGAYGPKSDRRPSRGLEYCT